MTAPDKFDLQTEIRCYWHRDDDGCTTLIPGCWARVHDPDGQCTCGKWREETAAATIAGYKTEACHMLHKIQQLRQALTRAGIADPTTPTDWRAMNAAQRKRRFHRNISEAGT